ncbi:MAG: hypothetical protein DRQ58_07125 [Gammaproteobacteria bacterium]|nr:MAG: hypothetical protein DRQ58_07125 [Gammaproteobacteria bacterium]
MSCSKLFIKSIVLAIVLISVAHAGDSVYETGVEKLFPHNIVIEYNNEQLDLFMTGLTIRRKYFLKIYSMAHYIQQSPIATGSGISYDNIYKNILQNNGIKQISMVFMRKLSAEQIQNSLRSGMQLNSSEADYLKILPQVEEFMQAIHADVRKNDKFVIRWHPDGEVISFFQGTQISSIKSVKFAETLWAIWFGDFSVVDRKALIVELLTNS